MSFSLSSSMKTILFTSLLVVTGIACFSQEVTPSGAFTYRYPIAIPPGTNGMAPQLALSYNSQAGNGMLGMGFQLEGLSAITRDRSYPVTFNDTTDHFLLDGQKLIKSSDGNYHTEREGFLKIQAVVVSDVVTYWIVTLKNGTKMYYGWTNDGEHSTANDGYIAAVDKNGKALVWVLSRVEDVNGNYYIVEYTEDLTNGDYYPARIVYTKNSGIQKYKSVEFSYESRLNPYTVYVPSKLNMDSRLKWITVKADGVLIRKYRLDYMAGSSTIKNLLVAVQEYGKDGTSVLPASTFEWQEGELNFDSPVRWFYTSYRPEPHQPRWMNNDGYSDLNILLDMDGDGLSDRVGHYDYPNNGGYGLWVWMREGNYFFDAPSKWLNQASNGSHSPKWASAAGDYSTLIDMNGDGRPDRVENYDNLNGGGYGLWVRENKGHAFKDDTPPAEPWYQSTANLSNMPKWSSATGDYNTLIDMTGDGRPDRVGHYDYIDGRGYGLWVWENNGHGFETAVRWFYSSKREANWPRFSYSRGDYNTLIDMTGDGLPDRVGHYDYTYGVGYGLWVWENNGHGFKDPTRWFYSSAQEENMPRYSSDTGEGDYNILMDMNGDGLTDRVGRISYYVDEDLKYDLGVWLNNGNELEEPESWLVDIGAAGAMPRCSTADGDSVILMDVNGDGLPDRVTDGLNVMLNNGHGFEAAVQWTATGQQSTLPRNSIGGGYGGDLYILTDIDGDALPDRVGHYRDSWGPGLWVWKNKSIPCRISAISNGSGGSVGIEYKPAPQVPGAVDSTDSVYPDIANKSSRPLVTKLTLESGFSDSIITTYEYDDGRMLMGLQPVRRNLGFRTITRTDEVTGTYVVTTYRQDVPYQQLVEKVEVFDDNENKYSEKQYSYSIPPAYDTLAYKDIQMTEQREYVYDGGPVEDGEEYRTRYVYGEYGNCTHVYNDGNVTNENANTTDDSYSVTVFHNDTTNWIFVPIKTTTYSHNMADIQVLSGEATYYYDGFAYDVVTKGLITKVSQIKHYEDTSPVETTYGYDAYGNLVWMRDPKATAAGTGYTLQYVYDGSYKAYVTTVTNAAGHSATIEYDNWMRPDKSIDANGAESEIEYDVFGRVVAEIITGDDSTYPTGKITYTNFVSILQPGNIKLEARGTGTDYITSYQYFDGFGRTLQAKSGAPGGWRTVDYYYDESGRPCRQSVPYWTDTSAYTTADPDQAYTEVAFDPVGRVTKQVNTDGTFSLMMYDKRFLTSVDTAGVISQTEVSGNTTISKANGLFTQTQSYLLNAYVIDLMRNESGVETGESVTTTTKQAWDGMRITDQAGNVVETVNDMAGRRLSYSDPDLGTWMWTYDLNMNVATQTDAMNRIISFDYDILNRPTAEYHGPVETRELVARYLYEGKNSSGQPDGEDHGFCLGRLTRVEYDGGWESYKYDSRGRIVESRVNIEGTTKTQTFSYDSADRVVGQTLPEGTARTPENPNARETLQYSYASDGNILSLAGKGGTYAGGLEFTAYGKLEDIIYGNGVATHYNYYDTETEGDTGNGNRKYSFRIEGIFAVNGQSETIAQTTYNYDVRDNILHKEFHDGTVTYQEDFSYDAFSRLKSANCPELYRAKHYEYDGLNNITEKGNLTYQYNANEGTRHLAHAVSGLKNESGTTVANFAYDPVGNMTSETGLYKVTIRAKRSDDALDDPLMELWINGEMQMKWIVSNKGEYAPYTWKGYWNTGSTINVVYRHENGTSTNLSALSVDYITVNSQTVQSESASAIFDRGSYSDGCFDGSDTAAGTETINETGALKFTVTGATPLVRLFEYDYNNMVTSINENGTVSTYTYNPSGQRVKKVEDGTATYYFYANYEIEKTATTETQIVYYYVNGEQIAQRTITETSDELLYIHKDHLGSAVRLTNHAGDIVQQLAYEPYGTTVYSHGNNEPSRQFTGQIKDGTGLYFYNARYYNPTLGRFTTADTVLDGLNRYTYCGNNPVRYVDPSGNYTYQDGDVWFSTVTGGQYVSDEAARYDESLALPSSGDGDYDLSPSGRNTQLPAASNNIEPSKLLLNHDDGMDTLYDPEPTVEQKAVTPPPPPEDGGDGPNSDDFSNILKHVLTEADNYLKTDYRELEQYPGVGESIFGTDDIFYVVGTGFSGTSPGLSVSVSEVIYFKPKKGKDSLAFLYACIKANGLDPVAIEYLFENSDEQGFIHSQDFGFGFSTGSVSMNAVFGVFRNDPDILYQEIGGSISPFKYGGFEIDVYRKMNLDILNPKDINGFMISHGPSGGAPFEAHVRIIGEAFKIKIHGE